MAITNSFHPRQQYVSYDRFKFEIRSLRIQQCNLLLPGQDITSQSLPHHSDFAPKDVRFQAPSWHSVQQHLSSQRFVRISSLSIS